MNIDNMSFGSTTTDITLRRTEVERTSVLKKLSGVYDAEQKMVFLFDVSGSMSERVAKSYENQYVWTDAILADIRMKAAGAVLRANGLMSDPMAMLMGQTLSAEEQEILQLADKEPGPAGEVVFNPKDDEELKQRVVQKNLIGLFSLQIDFTQKHVEPPKRIDLVKKLAKSELEKRFKEHPNSKVAVLPFGSIAALMFDDGQAADLWPALDKLHTGMAVRNPETDVEEDTGGGTDILAAIRRGLDVCRKKPSPVGVHHFIIVSDGEDGSSNVIGSWVPSLKASGVVLDYIHIGCEYANEGLKKACEALGGIFVTVNSERDFESKFIEVVHRKMLPAGA